MLITQSRFSHVAQLDGSFAAAVHKQVAVNRVEFGSSNNFGQLLHIDWLDVDNVCGEILKRTRMGE